MIEVVLLDSGVLSLACQRPGTAGADDCRSWIRSCLGAGGRVVAPAIANYEVRREFLRARKAAAVTRLEAFLRAEPDRYLPLTDEALLMAATLWAQARQQGQPTADPHALDGDAIVAAQALSLGLDVQRFVVATTNVRHISRFVPADQWQNIRL